MRSLRKATIGCLLLIGSFGLVAGTTGAVQARMLPFPQCLKLQSEKASLVAQGVQAHFDKGPAWALTSLSAEQIRKVRRLIALQEALLFRCDTARMKALQKRMSSPKFAKWKALKPPLPSRNPKFARRRR